MRGESHLEWDAGLIEVETRQPGSRIISQVSFKLYLPGGTLNPEAPSGIYLGPRTPGPERPLGAGSLEIERRSVGSAFVRIH